LLGQLGAPNTREEAETHAADCPFSNGHAAKAAQAERHDSTVNREMNDRLEASFNLETMRSLDAIAADLREACDRLAG
jgi:hypothetical protein